MKFEDLKIGMKVKVVSSDCFHVGNVGKIGHIIRLDPDSDFNAKVSFDSEGDETDWGNSSDLELVEDKPINSLEQQLLNSLIKSMEEALNALNLEHLDALSKAYQRIKSASNQTN